MTGRAAKGVDLPEGILKVDFTELTKAGVKVLDPELAAAEYNDQRLSKTKDQNPAAAKYPAGIALPTTYEQVAECVKFMASKTATVAGLTLAVAGGRHSAYFMPQNALVIDMCNLNKVTVDAVKETCTVQGGAVNRQVDAATEVHQLHAVLGNHGGVGIGSALQGGWGHLSNTHGFAVDSIVEYKVVTAAGDILTLTNNENDENRDLFWAMQGAGWAFAVLLEYTCKAHKVFEGPCVGGARVVGVKDCCYCCTGDRGDIVKEYRDMVLKSAKEWTFLIVMAAGGPVICQTSEITGDANSALKWLNENTPKSSRLFKLSEWNDKKSYSMNQKELEKDFPPVRAHMNMHYMVADLTDGLVEYLANATAGGKAPKGSVIICTHMCQNKMAEVAPEATPVIHRGSKSWMIVVIADLCKGKEKATQWLKGIFQAVEEQQPNYGTMVSWCDDSEGKPLFLSEHEVAERMYGANFPRLSQLKTKYDPSNLFCNGVRIPMA